MQIDLSTEPCKRYLRRHVNRKVAVVILYADIDGSTRMSMSIPASDFATILHIFSQEMTLAAWCTARTSIQFLHRAAREKSRLKTLRAGHKNGAWKS